MITILREQLGNNDIPVIIGELGDFVKNYHILEMKWVDLVNKELREIPAELKNCYLASADGLTHRGDGIHFNSA